MAPSRTVQVVPSLLAADRARLGEQLDAVKAAGASWVSVDVMDGHFVPNLSFGPDFVRLVKARGLTVDAHLMVSNPEAAAPWFCEAGADFVTVHLEACPDPLRAVRAIRERGARAGLAVKPGTAVEPLAALVGELDLALVMSVEPGFGGARFLPSALPKLAALRRAVDAARADCWLQVDGGITAETAREAAAAGADSLVAGSSVFGAPDPGRAFAELRAAAEGAFGSRRRS